MDAQFQELAREITESVTAAVTKSLDERLLGVTKSLDERFLGVTKSLDERLLGVTKSLDERLLGVTKSLDERLQGAFGDSEARIKKHIDEFENRAELRMKMHFENLDETVKTIGEGYGGSLEHIERELSELNKKVETKFSDHDLVLANHNARITKLEQR